MGRIVRGFEVRAGMRLMVDDVARVVPGSTAVLPGVLTVEYAERSSPAMVVVAGLIEVTLGEHVLELVPVRTYVGVASVHVLVEDQDRDMWDLDGAET